MLKQSWEKGDKSYPGLLFKRIKKLRNKKKILLILDEVQCNGRTGKFFALNMQKSNLILCQLQKEQVVVSNWCLLSKL